MKNRLWKAAILSIAVMALLLTGCGGSDPAANEEKESGQSGTAQEAQTEQEASMGRYMEQELTLPEEMVSNGGIRRSIKKLDSGELMLLDEMSGLYISPDEGVTWEKKEAAWLDEFLEKAYIMEMALASDGGTAFVYDLYEEDGEENVYDPSYAYVDRDGNWTDLSEEGEEQFYSFFFNEENQLYGYGLQGGVYAVEKESGNRKKLFETDGIVEYVCFTKDYMVAFATGGVVLYQMEQGIVAEEDQVLSDFVLENLGDRMGVNTDGYSLVAAGGEEENVIYLAFSQGLYRHVLGGTAMEQVMDGSLCSLGDQMLLLLGMEVLPNQEFVILYSNASLCRYAYDETVPTVPQEQISIYSLTEDYTIRQAVSMFQKQHPEAYVRYETGMTGEDGVTAEDALRNLNTKLMSGEGPDLLVLDELPSEAYREKGILADLSETVEELKEEGSVFPNMAEAYRKDGKIHSLPVRFRLSLLLGDREALNGVDSLEKLADAVEKLREKYPEGKLLGLTSEEAVLYTLGLSSEAAWTDDTGAVNESAVADFLDSARRIYQAELAGLTAEELSEDVENWSSDITGEGRYYAIASANAMDIARKTQRLGAGTVSGMNFDFNMISTIMGQEENFDWKLFEGQVTNSFIPKTEVGICAGSGENALALEFFRFLFGQELQSLELPAGFPVNKNVFETLKESPEDYGQAGIMIAESEEDTPFSLEIQWADAENYGRLLELAESAESVSTGDERIRDVVHKYGTAVLNGSMNTEEAVKEIVRESAIYLAE
ncbi:MAG: carbohydrate ABC transporter substrate-binding protein [Clostridiales bacterium]|nr:carbohydrate ABC transporter substrate-binding protein [Clostridiales bacterium]